MKWRQSLLLLGLSTFVCLSTSKSLSPTSEATFMPEFSKTDQLVILVKGDAQQSRPFGYSGSGSMHKASGSSSAGRLTFSPVPSAQNIPLERRSGVDITNRNNYGTDGYIPPGIYFLHYHRFDSGSHQARHRLGLSDRKCGETIRAQVGQQSIERTNLQFHVAFNDLEDFHPDVSKGCITLTTQRFFELFRDNFFSDSSPLPTCGGHQTPAAYAGQGNILVFVTDAADSQKQQGQLQIFNNILSGATANGLVAADFGAGAPTQALATLRTTWRAGLP